MVQRVYRNCLLKGWQQAIFIYHTAFQPALNYLQSHHMPDPNIISKYTFQINIFLNVYYVILILESMRNIV